MWPIYTEPADPGPRPAGQPQWLVAGPWAATEDQELNPVGVSQHARSPARLRGPTARAAQPRGMRRSQHPGSAAADAAARRGKRSPMNKNKIKIKIKIRKLDKLEATYLTGPPGTPR